MAATTILAGAPAPPPPPPTTPAEIAQAAADAKSKDLLVAFQRNRKLDLKTYPQIK